jgi:glycerophosphodiester phosphodiesterase
LKLLHDRYGTTKEILEGVDKQETEELLAALLELRGQFRNLQWYGEVNRRGFIKITKKLDKKLPNISAQRQYLESRVEPKPFAVNTELMLAMKSINEWISALGDTPMSPVSLTNGTSSKKYAPHLPLSFTSALDVHFRQDDSQELDSALSKTLMSFSSSEFAGLDENTVLLNLLQRAISCKAKKCIALLLSKTKSLDEANDINGRNCVHRLVIAIGRANITADEEKAAAMVLTIPDDHSRFISPATTPILQPPSGHGKSENSFSLGPETESVKLLSSLLEDLRPHQRNALISRDSYGRTPLHYAAQYGLIIICSILIAKMRIWDIFDVSEGIDDAKWQDNERWAPLHLAVIGGHPLTTKMLLEAEESSTEDQHILEVRHKVSESGIALSLAVKANFITIVQLLVDAGVDVLYQDNDGETAVHVAARFGHTDCARILIEGRLNTGRNLSALELPEKTFAWTPVFIAAVDGHRSVVELLLSYDADVERKDLSGWTAMEHAALRGHIEIAHIIAESIASKTRILDSNIEAPPMSSSPNSIASLEEKKSSIWKTGNGTTRPSESVKAFGHRYLTNESMILVSLGSMDMRKDIDPVTLDRIPIANAHSTQLDTALSLVVSAKGTKGEPSIIDLPVQDNLSTEPIVFTAADPTNVRLLFDIVPTYAGTKDKIVGRGAAMLGSVKQNIGIKRINLQGDISVPIMAADTLEVIGSVNFNFLVITPFSHPNMSITEKKTYWKSLASTMVIGHRGMYFWSLK